jgi:hypothetical protein
VQYQKGLRFLGTLFEKFPILAEELGLTTQYITEIGVDVIDGVKYGGVSQELKKLLYFCVRALIVIKYR